MSLLETVRGRATKATQPGDLLREVAAAEARLAALESQHGAAALDAFAHEPGAQGRLEDLNRELIAARERAQTLRAAQKAAVEREEAAILAQRAALQKTQTAAARKYLEARDAAAFALSAALAEAAKQYRILLERSAKAQSACPVLTKWPEGSLCSFDSLRGLVIGEMYRVSATGGRDDRRLPGAEPRSAATEWNPGAIKPLGDQLKQASAFALTKLTGKASE